MKLKFRIETRKIKQPRIVVLRLLENKGKIIEKSLGSFNSKRSYEHIVKQLNSEELYEFENFVKIINFSKSHFECDADQLDRFIIKTAPQLKEALFKIWEKAQEYVIDFTPEYEMLSFVLNRAKMFEQQLAVLTNNEFKALADLGVDIHSLNSPKRDLKEDQKIFKAVIEHTKSFDELAELFNSIAHKKYQKSPKFKPHHFEYFTDKTEQGRKQPFPKWYYTIAIDALCQNNIKPETIVSPKLITKHWLRLNKKANLKQTLEAFSKQFPQLKNDTICANIIKNSFVNDELLKMAQNKKNSSTPSVAIEQWLIHWKEKNKNPDGKTAIQAFNTEFPFLAKNKFFIEYIKNSFYEKSPD